MAIMTSPLPAVCPRLYGTTAEVQRLKVLPALMYSYEEWPSRWTQGSTTRKVVAGPSRSGHTLCSSYENLYLNPKKTVIRRLASDDYNGSPVYEVEYLNKRGFYNYSTMIVRLKSGRE